jgi:hypothetical protein
MLLIAPSSLATDMTGSIEITSADLFERRDSEEGRFP